VILGFGLQKPGTGVDRLYERPCQLFDQELPRVRHVSLFLMLNLETEK
jgi:hypothetical protein